MSPCAVVMVQNCRTREADRKADNKNGKKPKFCYLPSSSSQFLCLDGWLGSVRSSGHIRCTGESWNGCCRSQLCYPNNHVKFYMTKYTFKLHKIRIFSRRFHVCLKVFQDVSEVSRRCFNVFKCVSGDFRLILNKLKSKVTYLIFVSSFSFCNFFCTVPFDVCHSLCLLKYCFQLLIFYKSLFPSA